MISYVEPIISSSPMPSGAKEMRRKLSEMTSDDLNQHLLGILGKLPMVERVSWIGLFF